MTSKKSKKGKTVPLSDFLAAEPKLVTVRATNWSEIVDNEEEEAKPIVVNMSGLPTAPRAAHDIDYSTIPNTPPFYVQVSNLSFEANDDDLRKIFGDLSPKSARVYRDGTRSRGVGSVEFETREALIEALKRTDKEIYGRKIRVNYSDKLDSFQNENNRGFGNRQNRGGGEERPEMADRWKRAEPRSDETSDDRPSGGFNRDRQHRGDHGRSNMGGGSRDNQHGNDYGFGYPRSKDDRSGPSGGGGGRDRDYNRQGQRNRYQDDENRSNSGTDRPRYAGRYSDTRDTRDRNRENDETRDDQREPPRERQRLQLQPRTKPLEEFQPLSGSSSSINNVAANAVPSSPSNPDDSLQHTQDSSINEHQQQESGQSNENISQDEQSTVKPSRGAGASIFGGAKPVDTLARELEIEKKIKELQTTTTEPSGDTEEKGQQSSRPSYNRGDRDNYRNKRSSHNDEHRDRRDEGRHEHGRDYHNKRDSNDGRQYDDDNRKHNNDDNQFHRRGGQDRERYGGPSRRDQDSGRSGKYNHPERDNNRGNYQHRNQDTNEHNSHGQSSNNDFIEAQPRNQPRKGPRPTIQTEDNTNRLQLTNKFGMLDVDDLDDPNESEDAQSPSIDE